MPSTAIRSTRIGFYYQDLYAILVFLSNYEAKRKMEKFFVDFEYDSTNKKSYDLLVELIDNSGVPTQEVFEVKTGQYFKEKTGLVFETVADYAKLRKNSVLSINDKSTVIISKDRAVAVRNFRDHAQRLHHYTTLSTEDAQSALQYFKDKLSSDCYDSDDDLHTSIRAIVFEEGSPLTAIAGDPDSDIKDNVREKVRRVARNLPISFPNPIAFPEDMLIHELLSIIQSKAGTQESLIDEFRSAMINYYARYKLQTEGISPGSGGSLELACNDIEQLMNVYEGVAIPAETTQTEGGEVS